MSIKHKEIAREGDFTNHRSCAAKSIEIVLSFGYFGITFPTVFRPAIKVSTLFADTYRPLLNADVEMRLWKYEIDTIVVTKHNRKRL